MPDPQLDTLRLLPVSRNNWEKIVNLKVDESQQSYLPSNAVSLLEALYESLEPYAIYADSEVIGLLIIARWSGVHWITRIMIDANQQGKGFGRLALEAALEELGRRPNATEVRTTIDRRNVMGEYLFQQAGFNRGSDIDQHEFVMFRELD